MKKFFKFSHYISDPVEYKRSNDWRKFYRLQCPTNKNERMKIIIMGLATIRLYRYCGSYPSLLSVVTHFQRSYVSSPHCCYFKCLSFTYACYSSDTPYFWCAVCLFYFVFSSKLPGYSCNSSTSHLFGGSVT